VLVVDDTPVVLDTARRLLGAAGFDVRVAASGAEALTLFRERAGEIDCVLLDLEMPGLPGAETFAALRRIRPDVRVVFTSGRHEDEAPDEIVGGPGTGYVPKPYRLDTLRAAVEEVLGA